MEAQRWVTDVGGGPMVARWGSEHPSVPMILLLHGNGTSEHSLIEMSPWLPHGPVAYVAVRAPFERRQGYGWYADTDSGVPDPDELARSARWLLEWMGTEGDPERPVMVLGFREGVTVAGAMMMLEPERFAGGLLLYGAIPLEAGLPAEQGRLRGLPVYLARGSDDTRTPAALLDRHPRLARRVQRRSAVDGRRRGRRPGGGQRGRRCRHLARRPAGPSARARREPVAGRRRAALAGSAR